MNLCPWTPDAMLRKDRQTQEQQQDRQSRKRE
jgi:hypothetical protein